MELPVCRRHNLVTHTYFVAERFKAQAVNEFSVSGTTAISSLLAGAVIHTFGWDYLLWTPLPLLLLISVGLILIRRDPLTSKPAKPLKTEGPDAVV